LAQQLLLASAEKRARLALEAGSMGSFVCSLTHKLAAGDQRVCELFGVPRTDAPQPIATFLDRIHPEDRVRVAAAIERIIKDRSEYFEEFRVRRGSEWCWITGRGQTSENEDGELLLVGVNWDVNHRKVEEERLSILASEMDHRVKNAFSVMNALVRLGARSATSIKGFTETLTAQLRAMADAHRMSSLTARLEHGDTVQLAQVVRLAVAPWLTGDANRVVINEDVPASLSLAKVSAFAMLAYELATNAAKYGALGREEGRLTATITLSDEGETLFIWDERSDTDFTQEAEEERQKGTPIGFGTTLLQHCAATLKARFKRELRSEGLLIELRIPAVLD
jgi:PAS domain S-box-containing protein